MYFADSSFYKIDTSHFEFPKSALDSNILAVQVAREINKLQEEAFLAAQVDSILWNSSESEAKVWLYVGESLKFGNIDWSGVDDQWKQGALWRKVALKGEKFDSEIPLLLANDILKQADDQGYPLGKLYFTEKSIDGDKLSAKVIFDKGSKIKFGGIDKANDTIINKAFLEQYLSIEKGELFKMSLIQSIDQQLRQLPYITLASAPQVKLLGNDAYIDLNLKSLPASRFDFIIGVLPNIENERQFTISGELTADFKNKLKQGEEIYFHFQQLRPESQRIDFSAKYPYFLNLPFGIQGDFNLYRNGIESRDLNSQLGLQYRSNRYWESQFYVGFQSSRLIEIDSISILANQSLPDALDVRINNIGARVSFDSRDYPLNPRSGIFASLNITSGLKNTLPNLVIQSLSSEQVDFTNSYDSLDLSVLQIASQFDAEAYIPLKGLSTVVLGNKTGIKWSQAQVFSNEFYRIGGSNNLRGFDEETLRAQYYSVFTAEFRYLLALNSYFSAFFDYGLIYNPLKEITLDQPFGFGIGLRFQTNAGIFGIDVALGREQNNPIDFRNTKTHFGFISLF